MFEIVLREFSRTFFVELIFVLGISNLNIEIVHLVEQEFLFISYRNIGIFRQFDKIMGLWWQQLVAILHKKSLEDLLEDQMSYKEAPIIFLRGKKTFCGISIMGGTVQPISDMLPSIH